MTQETRKTRDERIKERQERRQKEKKEHQEKREKTQKSIQEKEKIIQEYDKRNRQLNTEFNIHLQRLHQQYREMIQKGIQDREKGHRQRTTRPSVDQQKSIRLPKTKENKTKNKQDQEYRREQQRLNNTAFKNELRDKSKSDLVNTYVNMRDSHVEYVNFVPELRALVRQTKPQTSLRKIAYLGKQIFPETIRETKLPLHGEILSRVLSFDEFAQLEEYLKSNIIKKGSRLYLIVDRIASFLKERNASNANDIYEYLRKRFCVKIDVVLHNSKKKVYLDNYTMHQKVPIEIGGGDQDEVQLLPGKYQIADIEIFHKKDKWKHMEAS